MSRSSISALALASLTIPMTVVGAGPSTSTKPQPSAKTRIEMTQKAPSQIANLPIYFEPNRGQTDPSVSFLANIGSTRLFLTRDSAVFAIQKAGQVKHGAKQEAPAVIRMRTVGASRDGDYQSLEALPGKSNYLIGSDSRKWITDVPQFGKVTRHGVYPGIDLVFYGTQRQFEYDFVLAPGADPNRIELAYDGVDSIRTNSAGDLVLATAAGDFIQKKPKVFQTRNGQRTEVASNYRIEANKNVRFEVARYDRGLQLVIDPVIVFNAMLGGTGTSQPYGVALDNSLNVYVTGIASSPDFPLMNPFQGGFQSPLGGTKTVVFKLNSTGSALVYSTYLGGSGDEDGLGIAVDSSGNAIVASATSSTNFPTLGAAQGSYGGGAADSAVTKLNSSGNGLIFSTYLGGVGDDQPQGAAVDVNGNVYVAGLTDAAGFPVTTGSFQTTYSGATSSCFVAKYGSSGNLLYSTYLGGNSKDACTAIAADSSGDAYVTGFTTSANFPVSNGAAQVLFGGVQDGFITKINPTGTQLLYSTFYGGNALDLGRSIAVDSVGAAYITGTTESTNLPIVNAFQSSLKGFSNAFVAKLAPNGASFNYSTYFGGRKVDSGDGIAIDGTGNAYVVGATISDNFPGSNAIITSKPGVGGVIMKSIDGGQSFAASDTGISAFVANYGIVLASGVLLAPVNGSVYESNNNGASWVNSGVSPIAGLAQSPSVPTTVYAYPANPSFVWSTTNGGNTWNPLPVNNALPLAFSPSAMAVSPSSSTTLLASGSGGVWVSSNGGASWGQTGGVLNGTQTSAIAFLGDSTDALTCTGGAAGVYRTSGSLAAWQLSNSGISSSSVCHLIVTDPNNAGIVYVSASDGLYRSTTGGATWAMVTSLPLTNPVLAVAPGNSSFIVAGGINGGLYYSSNAGSTWTQSGALTTTPIMGVAITAANTVYASVNLLGESAGFAASVSSGGSSLNYSTYLGSQIGGLSQGASAVAADSSGNAYIVGQTSSPFYNATNGALSEKFGGINMFITKLSAGGAACQVTVANTSIQAYSAGGAFPIEVFAPAGCFWTANTSASWVSIVGASSATGAAGTNVVVGGNSTGVARSTTVNFSTGLQITVNQDPGGCSYVISNPTSTPSAAAGSGTVNLTSTSGCSWTAVSSEAWLTVTGTTGSTGAGGAGTVTYSFTANPNAVARVAKITVGGTSTFTLTQAAGSGTSSGANYTGSVDAFTCSGIVGWAADRNALNTSITVSLWDATLGTQIASVTANISRADVGTVLGDNGLHGFSIPIPSAYQNGVSHTYQIHYASTATSLPGSPVTLTCGAVGTSPNYTGSVDISNCAGIVGWAADRNALNTSITVSLWDATLGTQIASTTANILRADVGTALGDNGLHGYNLSIPTNYQDGASHSYQIHFASSATQVPGSPVTLTCGTSGGGGGTPSYTGNVDAATCTGIVGWVADRNALNTSITVSLWDAALNTQIASTTANISRADVGRALGDNGLHGFNLQIPSSYQNGANHTYQIHFASTATQVTGSPVSLTCGTSGGGGGTPNYTGSVDITACTGIVGWAADRNALNTSITVSLWDAVLNTQIASTTANIFRGDVGTALGDNGLHGFNIQIPQSYQNGVSHSYQLHFASTATQLPGSPVNIACGSGGGGGTPNYAGSLDSATCSGGFTGWAADRNALNTSIIVSLWDAVLGTQIASTTANVSRPDVGTFLGDNGLHGFTIAVPISYQNGVSHSYQVRFASSSTQLAGSPKSFTCGSSGGASYAGNVDVLSCSTISGWAANLGALNTSINVNVFAGSQLIDVVTANISRPDVGRAIGDNGLHGFSSTPPVGIRTGQPLTITVEPAGSTFVLNGSGSLTCQ